MMIVINVKMVMNIIHMKKFVKVNSILNLIKFVIMDFCILIMLIKEKVLLVDLEQSIIVII